MSNFRQRPMHLMGGVSVLMFACGCFLALFLARVTLPLSVDLPLSAALPALFVGAVLTTMIGLIAEWKVHHSIEHARHGSIAETIGVGNLAGARPFSMKQSMAENGLSQKLPTALIVDDDANTRELTAEHLRKAGWRVLTASSYAESHGKLNTSLDVLILNVDLQDDSGLDLTAFVGLVRKALPSSEIIFLPSGTREKANIETMHLGAFDYVPRPVEPGQLVSVALRALNQGRQSALASGV